MIEVKNLAKSSMALITAPNDLTLMWLALPLHILGFADFHVEFLVRQEE